MRPPPRARTRSCSTKCVRSPRWTRAPRETRAPESKESDEIEKHQRSDRRDCPTASSYNENSAYGSDENCEINESSEMDESYEKNKCYETGSANLAMETRRKRDLESERTAPLRPSMFKGGVDIATTVSESTRKLWSTRWELLRPFRMRLQRRFRRSSGGRRR